MLRSLLLTLLAASTLFSLRANPTGGAVAAGAASIAGQGSASVTVNQASNTAIINWQTFSIGSGEATKFIQLSSTSATLNRVLGGQTSIIDGTLSANGRIFLLNGNGIVVGQNGVITTAGFTGSTRDIADSDFLDGNYHFVGSGDGGVTNYGRISALGGDVVLIGKTVDNEGTINASGTAGLIAGDDVLLAQQNADGSTITVNPVSSPTAATTKIGVKNGGRIKASAAELKAANGNIYALAIKNDGMIQATTVTRQGGHIYLTSDSGTIVNSGTLDASASAARGHGGAVLVKSQAGKVVQTGKIVAQGGQGGVGGNVDISGAQLDFTGMVDLTAAGGTTGDLLLDPATLTVVSGAAVTTGAGAAQPDPGDNASDVNDPNSSTITNGTVNAALAMTNLTLDADNTITVNAAITWMTANTLTLKTNNVNSTINLNAAITGTNGGLVINAAGAGDRITPLAAVDVSSFILASGAWFQLADEADYNNGSNVDNGGDIPRVTVNNQLQTAPLPGFTASTDFEIQNGTFLRADGGNGGDTYYALVDIYGVQGIDGFLDTNFTELGGANIDGADAGTTTATWNGGAGFIPIGTQAGVSSFNDYNGEFSNSNIQNVTINDTSGNPTGLVAELGANGQLNGVTVSNSTITGSDNVGGLAGVSYGQINGGGNSGTTVNGTDNVGGVVGVNYGLVGLEDGYIQTTFSGTVNGTNAVGGIAGDNGVTGDDVVFIGDIENADSSGTVTGNTGATDVGGIAGDNEGTINQATVSATVSGDDQVGGVAGTNGGTISNAVSSAAVNATQEQAETQSESDFGGIAGVNSNFGTISSSTYSGTITPDDADNEAFYFGGITGENYGEITTSNTYPGAMISADEYVGGITGANYGSISDSYNSATVMAGANAENYDGSFYLGGIAGYNGTSEGGDGGGGVSESVPVESAFAAAFVSDAEGGPQPSGGTIQTSYNTGSVSGDNYVGGLVGYNDSGATIDTAYNVGSVTGTSDVGGIAGYNDAVIDHTYDSGPVTGDTDTGALIGFEDNDSDLENSYWDTSTSNQGPGNEAGSSGGTQENIDSVDSTDAYTQANNNGGDGIGDFTSAGYAFFGASTLVPGTNGVYAITAPGGTPDGGGGPSWYIIEGQTRPLLAMEAVSSINNPHSLQLVAENLSGFYQINYQLPTQLNGSTEPIDMSVIGNPAEIWNTAGFVPIGANPQTGTAFTGDFQGNYQTIQDLYIERPSENNVGLFGYVVSSPYIENINGVNTTEHTMIQDLTLNDSSIIGDMSVGGVAGTNDGIITLVQNLSDGTPTLSGANYMGGTATVGLMGQNDAGGIVGDNGATGQVGEDVNTAAVQGTGYSPFGIGGLAGANTGTITQSYNTGNIGAGTETAVGGLAGYNGGQVDDSYSGGGSMGGTIDGAADVGGLVGFNDSGAILETSYNTSPVGTGNGELAGINYGTVLHTYWDTDNSGGNPGIATNNNTADTTDAVGYTTAQLMDARNFSQGSAPTQWDFSPEDQNGNHGPWAIDEYSSYYTIQNNQLVVVSYQVNDGLPTLQFQNPVGTQITATNGMTPYPPGENHGTEYYGYQPGYTPTGSGASELSTVTTNGVSITTSGGSDAGDTQEITPSATPTPGNSIEFVPGTVDIVPDPITITADSYTIPSGAPAPNYGVTYSGFTANTDSGDLIGMPTFTVTPAGLADGIHTITPGGQTSPIGDQGEANFDITYVNGVLNVGSLSPTQEFLTFETELQNIEDSFENNPANGLDPLFFIIYPNETGLGGELLGAINDQPGAADYIFVSGTSDLPALDRLVTPGTGVVEIIDGRVVIVFPPGGTPGGMPSGALGALNGVLSPGVYNQLFSLTHGTP
jgi:filamentous hemagglutinin family protein